MHSTLPLAFHKVHTVRSVTLWDCVTAVTANPAVLNPAITRAERFRALAAEFTGRKEIKNVDFGQYYNGEAHMKAETLTN